MDSIDSIADEYQLGPFKIKVKENLLIGDEGEIVLLPKVMTLLVHLCQHSQQVVTFDDLNNAIWPKEVVGDNAIYNLVGQLRKALGDNASKPVYIQTVSKVGYRLLLDAKPILPSTDPNNIADNITGSTDEEPKPQPKKSKGLMGLLLFIVFISMTTAIVSSKKRYSAPNDDAEKQMQLVRYQLYRGDSNGLDQAIESLQQLIAIEPRWVIPKLELAYSFVRKASLLPAENGFWLDKASAIATDINAGDKGRRLIEMINAKRQLPFDAQALFSKEDVLISARLAYSDVLFTQGKTALALEQAQLALAQCADCPYIYRKVATTQMVLGQVQEGFSSFSQYRMLINRSNHNPADNAGYVPLNKQSLSEMVKWHVQTPMPTTLLNHQSNALALFYLSLGEINRAKAVVMSSPDTSTEFYDLYTHAAIAGAAGEFETSYALLAKRQESYPDNDRFKLSVVYALWQLGRYEEAMRTFEQFSILPTSAPLPDTMPFATWSLYAALLDKTGNKTKANAILTQLAKDLTAGITTGSQEADIRLASILALQGKTDDSLTQLRTAVSQGWVSDFNQNWWQLEDSPYFRSLHSNAEFQRIVADYHDSIAVLSETAAQ